MSDECPICYESYETVTKYTQQACTHDVCAECATHVRRCPLCRVSWGGTQSRETLMEWRRRVYWTNQILRRVTPDCNTEAICLGQVVLMAIWFWANI